MGFGCSFSSKRKSNRWQKTLQSNITLYSLRINGIRNNIFLQRFFFVWKYMLYEKRERERKRDINLAIVQNHNTSVYCLTIFFLFSSFNIFSIRLYIPSRFSSLRSSYTANTKIFQRKKKYGNLEREKNVSIYMWETTTYCR